MIGGFISKSPIFNVGTEFNAIIIDLYITNLNRFL